jgi:hypothetical protein
VKRSSKRYQEHLNPPHTHAHAHKHTHTHRHVTCATRLLLLEKRRGSSLLASLVKLYVTRSTFLPQFAPVRIQCILITTEFVGSIDGLCPTVCDLRIIPLCTDPHPSILINCETFHANRSINSILSCSTERSSPHTVQSCQLHSHISQPSLDQSLSSPSLSSFSRSSCFRRPAPLRRAWATLSPFVCTVCRLSMQRIVW